MTSPPIKFGNVAKRLHDIGWRPIPCHGKRPLVCGWNLLNKHPAKADELHGWIKAFPNANCGLAIPDDLVVVDLDETDPELAQRLHALAERCLGPTPLERVGQRPKTMRIYRLDRVGAFDTKRLRPVEIMCGSGQFVAFGVHPKTNQPYQWIGPATPLDLAPNSDAFPCVSAATINNFLNQASPGFRCHQPTVHSKGGYGGYYAEDFAERIRKLRMRMHWQRALALMLSEAVPGERHNLALYAVGFCVRMRLKPELILDLFAQHFAGLDEVPLESVGGMIDWAQECQRGNPKVGHSR